MSNYTYPVLPGLSWGQKKTPEFSTRIQKSYSGKEVRLAMYFNPIYNYELSYEFLRGNSSQAEFQNLLGFYLQMQGSFDTFFYQDPEDTKAFSSTTLQPIGLGNNLTNSFQLLRLLGNYAEPVCFVSSYGGSAPANTGLTGLDLPSIYVNGVAKSPATYTISQTGLVTFLDIPVSGNVIQWSGAWYYRCRFTDDTLDFDEFAQYFWEAKKVAFRGSLSGKI